MHHQLPEEACERLQNMMEAFQERFDSFWDKWEDRDWPHSDGRFEELKEKIQARHQEMRERFLDMFDNWCPDMDDEEEDDQQENETQEAQRATSDGATEIAAISDNWTSAADGLYQQTPSFSQIDAIDAAASGEKVFNAGGFVTDFWTEATSAAQTVPEPATSVLFLVGGATLMIAIRRRSGK